LLDKKGFLFTVTVFLILIYILLSVSVWVKSIEASEQSYSEFYKESTVELTIEQITPEKVDNVTYIIMNRALSRLNDHAIEHSVDQGPPVDEGKNIREALFSLLVNGSANGSYFDGNADIPSEENSSLTAWKDNLNASLRAIGIFVEDFNVSEFQLNQTDIDRLDYSFDMTLRLKDYTNVSSVSRTYHVANQLDITGLVDPALARNSRDEAGDNHTVYRQFFFKKDLYPNYTDISVSRLSQSTTGGQGWVYGQLAMASGSANLVPEWNAVAPQDRASYILVGTYDQMAAINPLNRDEFAGFILTNAPVLSGNCSGHQDEDKTFNPLKYSGSNCTVGFGGTPGSLTSKPFIVAPGFNVTHAPECPVLDGSNLTRRCVLLLNSYLEPEVQANPSRKLVTAGSGLYSVESLRDFVMCGYYTHNPAAPSYLQRLMNNSYARNSTEFGIETFVVGIYANDYSVYDVNSRLDRELFNGSIDGIKIRGLPGCRNFNSCSDSPITGIFSVSSQTSDDYGLDQIACDNGAAGCSK
jgi:hypothetical protein